MRSCVNFLQFVLFFRSAIASSRLTKSYYERCVKFLWNWSNENCRYDSKKLRCANYANKNKKCKFVRKFTLRRLFEKLTTSQIFFHDIVKFNNLFFLRRRIALNEILKIDFVTLTRVWRQKYEIKSRIFKKKKISIFDVYFRNTKSYVNENAKNQWNFFQFVWFFSSSNTFFSNLRFNVNLSRRKFNFLFLRRFVLTQS